MKCEIQVTSLIAHTWSEIMHEKGYKFEGELPGELERRKYLLAGILVEQGFMEEIWDLDKLLRGTIAPPA